MSFSSVFSDLTSFGNTLLSQPATQLEFIDKILQEAAAASSIATAVNPTPFTGVPAMAIGWLAASNVSQVIHQHNMDGASQTQLRADALEGVSDLLLLTGGALATIGFTSPATRELSSELEAFSIAVNAASVVTSDNFPTLVQNAVTAVQLFEKINQSLASELTSTDSSFSSALNPIVTGLTNTLTALTSVLTTSEPASFNSAFSSFTTNYDNLISSFSNLYSSAISSNSVFSNPTTQEQSTQIYLLH